MNRKWWTLGAVSVATFMLLLDITVVNTALPAIQRDLGGSFTDLQWVIDAYALSLGGAGADRRLARRPARPAPRLRVRARGLLARLVPRALSPDPTFLNVCAGGAGHRRRDHVRRLPRPGRAGVPERPRARDGDGHLRGDDRHRGRDRAAGRRPAHRRLRLAVGLPAQRADRSGGDRRHLLEGRRVARPQRDPDRLGGARRPSPRRSSCSCWRWCAATTRAGAAR